MAVKSTMKGIIANMIRVNVELIFYYASAFRRIKRYLLHPEVLDRPADKVCEDID